MHTTFKLTTALITVLLLLSPIAKADGLADLKTTLAALQDDATIRAKVSVQIESTEGEGKELSHKTGVTSAQVERSSLGMKVSYPAETLKQLATERANLENPDGAQANTSPSAAVEAINASNLRIMTNASQYLLNKLDRATLKSEQAETLQGQHARLLIFDLRKANLSKKEQTYVKKYEGTLKVWTSADGTPLASIAEETYSGRAYLVVGFKVAQTEQLAFSTPHKRLVALRYETLNSSAGGGEIGSTKIIRTLDLQP